MAALGPDGAEGAALTGALASSDEIENLVTTAGKNSLLAVGLGAALGAW